jgi:hypothetical protein
MKFRLLVIFLIMIYGCSKPGGNRPENISSSLLHVVSINKGATLQSDVLKNGAHTDDIVEVVLRNDLKPSADPLIPTTPTTFNNITITSYRVTYYRDDNGPVPSPFNGSMNLFLPANPPAKTTTGTTTTTTTSVQTGQANIVVVRAFAKGQSPLVELIKGGEIFARAIIEFFGKDGNGRDVKVSGSLSILFGNFPDTTTTSSSEG